MDGPLHITHRAKTTQTIIEKLRREQGRSLARMQDIAGIQAAWRAAVRREIPAEIRATERPIWTVAGVPGLDLAATHIGLPAL